MRSPRVAPRRQVRPARHQPPAKVRRVTEGRRVGVAAGLMAACCGVHLLLAAGLLAGLGAWFVGHSLVVAAGAIAITLAAAVGWRTAGRRRGRDASSTRCRINDSETSPPERPRP